MKLSKLIVPVMLAATLIFTGCAQQQAAAPAASTPAAPAVKTVGTAPDGNEAAIEKAAMKLASASKEGGYQLASVEDVKKMMDEKKDMIIIDTMPADFYGKGHLAGALNAELPKTGMKDVTADQKAAFEKLLGTDKNKTIVVYCGFTACGRSDVGAVLAKQAGFANVYRMPGGIIAWQDMKFETVK